jgi:hypothetical protein
MTGRLSFLRRTLPLLLTCCLWGFEQDAGAVTSFASQEGLSNQILTVDRLEAPPPDQFSSAPPSGQFSSAPHTIRGTAVNSVTGEPIYRALVQIGGQFATLTDHEGRFEFDGVTQTGFAPWAMKPGYFPERESHFYSGATQTAGQPADEESLVVKLVPEVVISGTVTGQEGEPLSGISVHLKVLAVSDGISRWSERQGTTTNSEGQYRFYDLEAGKFAVVTGFHAEGLADAQSSVAYVPARFPEKAQGLDAGAMVLAAGDHREVNLSPPMEKLYPVSGVVSGYAEGKPVVLRAETLDGEEISASARFNQRTGEFRIMLPGGNCVLTATSFQQPDALEGKLSLTVPEPQGRGVSIGLEPPATIPVEIDKEAVDQPTEGQPNSDAWSGMDVHLTRADGSGTMLFLSALPVRHSVSDDASSPPGPMRIEGVSPGRYFLQATPQSPWYVASATCGGVDLMRDELAIAGSAAGCAIRIVVRNDSGSVHVTVRDPGSPTGQIAARTFVTLLPVDSSIQRAIFRPAQPGADVSIDGVGPGRYLVIAQDRPRELAYRDPETMRRYASLGQRISVTANGKADAEVNLVHGEP